MSRSEAELLQAWMGNSTRFLEIKRLLPANSQLRPTASAISATQAYHWGILLCNVSVLLSMRLTCYCSGCKLELTRRQSVQVLEHGYSEPKPFYKCNTFDGYWWSKQRNTGIISALFICKVRYRQSLSCIYGLLLFVSAYKNMCSWR